MGSSVNPRVDSSVKQRMARLWRGLLVAVLIVLVAVAIGLFVSTRIGPTPTSVPMPQHTVQRIHANSDAALDKAEPPSVRSLEVESGTGTDAPVGREQLKGQRPTCVVTVAFVDSRDAPLANFAFTWLELNLRARIALRKEGPSALASRQGTSAIADADGRYEFHVPSGTHLILRSSDDEFVRHSIIRSPAPEPYLDHVIHDCIESAGSSMEVVSRWDRSLPMNLTIRYEDGRQFGDVPEWGRRVVWQDYDPADRASTRRFRSGVVNEYSAPFAVRVATGTGLLVSALSMRPGYQSTTVWELLHLEGDVNAVAKDLVIPKANSLHDPFGIEIDCTALPPDTDLSEVRLAVYASDGSCLDRIAIPVSRLAISRPILIPGFPGTLCVQMSGAWAWRSEPIEIEPGTVKKLRANPTAGGAIRARIVSGEGEPLAPAVVFLCQQNERYPADIRGSTPRSYDGQSAFAGSDGVVTLVGAPVGAWVIGVEAKGYEPAFIPVDVAPRQTSDIGDVVMTRAVAVITATISSVDEVDFTTYVAYLIVSGGSVYSGSAGFDQDGRIVFRGIPSGQYYLFVSDRASVNKPGVGGWGRHVRVNADEATVNIDVSRPRGHQE